MNPQRQIIWEVKTGTTSPIIVSYLCLVCKIFHKLLLALTSLNEIESTNYFLSINKRNESLRQITNQCPVSFPP